MRVKRLEVQGFKSFKDKTVIHFDHTITGIVGPNGCGKSNIVDAFFWVMGEQSYKHMRGSGSEDLIFNGSSKYAPLGFAEATLVMEHDIVDTQNAPAGASSTDEPSTVIKTKEVSVTRRVLRSGEGEYFINGAPARLKDIHELFMDTGIGAKGYSIIEQGQIGKIVNAKPEERRVLIEEAAGIAKYKARKKESLRKMEATQSNLSRLNDVIQEIERSMGSLERQAQKAGRWKRFKEELTEKEMTWGRRKNHVIRQKLDQLKNDKDALDIELLALKTQLLTAENDSESDRTQQLTLNKKAEDLQVQIQAMASELTRSQSQLELSKHRQSDLAQQLESLQSEKIELQESIAYELTQIQSIQAQHEEAQQILESHETVVTSEEEVISISRQKTSDARLQLDDSKRALMNQIAEFSAQNSKVAAQQSRLSSLDENLSKMKAQIIALHQKQAEQESLVSDSVHAYEALVEQKANTEQALNLLKAQFNQKQTEYTEKKLNHSQAQQELTKLESKLQSLVELNESYEGFSDGAKHAFDWIKQKGLSDAFTTLSQSLKIQSGFENATQAWLENKIQTLLCSDTAQAQSLIQYLKTEEKGRIYLQLFTTSSELNSATFLKAKNSFENFGITVKGLLSDFVECSSTAKGLFDYVIVVDHIPTTLQETFGYHLVSLDGTCLENNGQLRAGSGYQQDASSAGASLLLRNRAIEELTVQSKEQAARVQVLAEICETLAQECSQLETQLYAQRDEAQDLNIKMTGAERDQNQAKKSLAETLHSLESHQSEEQELLIQIESSQNDYQSASLFVQEFNDKKETLELTIQTQSALLEECESEQKTNEVRLNEIKIKEASLRERSLSVARELETANKVIEDRKRRLQDVERLLDRNSSERNQFTGTDDEAQEKITDLIRQLDDVRSIYSQIKDELEIINHRVNQSHVVIKNLHQTGDLKTAQVNAFALEMERLTADHSHLVQNLEEKYGVGCLDNPAVSAIQEEMNEPVVTVEMSAEEEKQLNEDVERLREKIRQLGDVNPEAVDQFEEIKKRHDYLLTEKADLTRSIDNLNEAIDHINKTSEERFRKAFEAIADRFERLFPIIFGGGQAKLSLVYPEGSQEILDAGVDILAQPPGKKIVNISLLSGGEKALTAVSMIFAIFMVKPSPFCVLDEVDAPLDDANIGKFNALLKEMSAKSQFIIITHNKKTMELNDTLYGVTMEEPGVSKLISIEMK